MDEFDAILRARRVVQPLTMTEIGLPIQQYLKAMSDVPDGIVLRVDNTLGGDEAGHTVSISGRRCIIVNGNDREERQRFTACHEVAHMVLGLPTEHDNAGSQFARRSLNEVLCDVFAAELLLPCHLFQPLVQDADVAFSAIETLGERFGASLATTGSRFAAVCDRPCAFVLTQKGTIRYASRSKSLRESAAWIRPNQRVPDSSLAAHLIRGAQLDGPIEIGADEWFDDWKRGGVVFEDARHFSRWDETLVLVWFDDDVPPSSSSLGDGEDDGELGLRPLDGVLPWPGKSRRRR